jgi:hypothetical protein
MVSPKVLNGMDGNLFQATDQGPLLIKILTELLLLLENSTLSMLLFYYLALRISVLIQISWKLIRKVVLMIPGSSS